jgi:hypothetical protein
LKRENFNFSKLLDVVVLRVVMYYVLWGTVFDRFRAIMLCENVVRYKVREAGW